MKFRFLSIFTAVALISNLAVVPSVKANNRGKAIIGGIAVGIGAALLINELNKQKRANQQGHKPPSSNGAGRTKHSSNFGWMTRSQVAQMQQALNDLGFNAGDVDGKAGAQTQSAVREYQRMTGDRPTEPLTAAKFDLLVRQARQHAETSRENANLSAAPAPEETGSLSTPALENSPSRPAGPPTGGSAVESDVAAAPAEPDQPNPVSGDSENSSESIVASTNNPPAQTDTALSQRDDAPGISENGQFAQYQGVQVTGRIVARSSVGRRVTVTECAAFCETEEQCNAYVSYNDGRCELADDGEKRISDERSRKEVSVVGVRRSATPSTAAN